MTAADEEGTALLGRATFWIQERACCKNPKP